MLNNLTKAIIIYILIQSNKLYQKSVIMYNNVRKYRENLAWTKAELARKANVTPQTVARMEKNLPTRRDSELKVAKALEKSHEKVFPAG